MNKYLNEENVEEESSYIPSDVPNYSLPDYHTLQKYEDMRDRVWWIEGEIFERSALECARYIQRINREDDGIPVEQRKPIKLFIYSVGGDLVATFLLIDTILTSQTPVYTINAGEAMSAACLILICGQKRFAYEHSHSLIHTGHGGAQGDYEKIVAAMDDYKMLIENMRNIILSRTTITPALYNKKRAKDWYQSSADQVKYGIVDSVIMSQSEVL